MQCQSSTDDWHCINCSTGGGGGGGALAHFFLVFSSFFLSETSDWTLFSCHLSFFYYLSVSFSKFTKFNSARASTQTGKQKKKDRDNSAQFLDWLFLNCNTLTLRNGHSQLDIVTTSSILFNKKGNVWTEKKGKEKLNWIRRGGKTICICSFRLHVCFFEWNDNNTQKTKTKKEQM